ncbi:MAG: hypothetical protein H6584_02085 [Flavobacteriales bacterium]|nr:hypothetical protein [Flavobacteriales bacterium]
MNILKFKLIVLFSICIYSCDKNLDILPDYSARNFSILNLTDKEFTSAIIYVGALIDDKFIPTDSLVVNVHIPPRTVNSKVSNLGVLYSETTLPTWSPNIETVGLLSNTGTFLLKLSDGGERRYYKNFTFPNPRIGNTLSFDILDDNLTYPDTKETTN